VPVVVSLALRDATLWLEAGEVYLLKLLAVAVAVGAAAVGAAAVGVAAVAGLGQQLMLRMRLGLMV
jgi:hypothetical protein